MLVPPSPNFKIRTAENVSCPVYADDSVSVHELLAQDSVIEWIHAEGEIPFQATMKPAIAAPIRCGKISFQSFYAFFLFLVWVGLSCPW